MKKERYTVDGSDVTDCKYFNEFYCHNKKLKKKICKGIKQCSYKNKLNPSIVTADITEKGY